MPMQLQATKLPGIGARYRIEDQYSISYLVSDLKTRHSISPFECYHACCFDCVATTKLP